MYQDDFHQPHEKGPHTEIIYTVRDVSSVEQGAGGFVQSVKGLWKYFDFSVYIF